MVMSQAPASNASGIDLMDAALLGAIEGGLPLDPKPYAAVAQGLGITEADVIDRLGRLVTDGTIRRLGVVVRHHELGYSANAMVVWALPDERVTELGERIGGLPFVTLSYRRPKRPGWPYNLFTMIHGRDRAAVLAQVDRIKDVCGLPSVNCAVLFSGRRFKQRGARYGTPRVRSAEQQRESLPASFNAAATVGGPAIPSAAPSRRGLHP
jgi:DNA-binding Lrp family transcriptional regulator